MIYAWCIGLYMAGAVAAINLSHLVATNPDYHAAWWKVGAAVALAALFTANVKREAD